MRPPGGSAPDLAGLSGDCFPSSGSARIVRFPPEGFLQKPAVMDWDFQDFFFFFSSDSDSGCFREGNWRGGGGGGRRKEEGGDCRGDSREIPRPGQALKLDRFSPRHLIQFPRTDQPENEHYVRKRKKRPKKRQKKKPEKEWKEREEREEAVKSGKNEPGASPRGGGGAEPRRRRRPEPR